MYSAGNKPLCISTVYLPMFCIYNAERATSFADPFSCVDVTSFWRLWVPCAFSKGLTQPVGFLHYLSFDGDFCPENSRQTSYARRYQ